MGFIYCGVLGMYSYIFVDYGDSFKVIDRDGIEKNPYLISNISNSDPGVVTINNEKAHNFETGDWICIHEVEGMKEVCPNSLYGFN